MINLLDFTLTFLLNFGYPAIILTIIISYLGIPLPLNAIILAAGALSYDGTLNIQLLIPIVTVTAVIGDSIGYFLGKKYGIKFLKFALKKIGKPNLDTENLFSYVNKYGFLTVFLTRWLISPIGVPINIISGISHYNYKRFFIATFLGELLWANIYLQLGYTFGQNWREILEYISSITNILVLLFLGVLFVFVGVKYFLPRG